MTEVIKDESGALTLSVKVEPGTYLATALVLGPKAREESIYLETRYRALLVAGSKTAIWTDGLAVCFPVVFLFGNGDLGLYHAMISHVDDLQDWLNRPDLLEIQVFEQKNHIVNECKVYRFVHCLMNHYKDKPHRPRIMMQETPKMENYGVALCYHSPSGKPVILVGFSNESRGMAETQQQCKYKEDKIEACPMLSAEKRMLPTEEQIQKKYDTYMGENAPDAYGKYFKKGTKLTRRTRIYNDDEEPKGPCCNLI